ncbi:MAG TPA: leucine-rich repeat domain-containing protein [Kiritimatiellia bacterium]|nr:leucine-rich repeat domain-containing protein [Kiritimatiellia bacterium]
MNARTCLVPALFVSAMLLAFPAHAATEGPYTYTVSGGKATITGFDPSYSGALIITNELGGCPVTAIGYEAFADCYALASVTIPASVTSIGGYAFYNCSSLTSATIGDGVTSIGSYAFYNCISLTAINVSENNLHYASIDGVLFDKTLTALIQCPGAFSGHFTIPGSVTQITFFSFANCTALTSVTIPDGVTSIGAYAFYDCFSLASVSIPDSVVFIGDYAFAFCSSLAEATIPDGVTRINRGAFTGCTSLESVFLPDTVTSIGDDAFSFCYRLATVLFTGDSPSVGQDAFDATPDTIYYLPGTSDWGASAGGRPAVCWNPVFSPASPPRFSAGRFACTLAGNANIPVRIEACESLTDPCRSTVADTVIPASGILEFSDPDASSRPSCFYRITFPQ